MAEMHPRVTPYFASLTGYESLGRSRAIRKALRDQTHRSQLISISRV
jgi:hypothetical protein